jgi:hypothetical protein
MLLAPGVMPVNGKTRRKSTIKLDVIDLLLMAIIGVLGGIIVVQIVPAAWMWCVLILNCRKWSRWVWISIGLTVLVLLVVLRARQTP